MSVSASKPLIWAVILLIGAASSPVRAETQQDDLIGCWSAAYEYDGLENSDSSPAKEARLCSREPSAKACGDRSYLHVTYCFDREGKAYGGETHCWSTAKGKVCHGTDGLSGTYRLQGNRMNFFQTTGDDETQELAWSCSLSFPENGNVLQFGDCEQDMKTLFRDCDPNRTSEEYKTEKCQPLSK